MGQIVRQAPSSVNLDSVASAGTTASNPIPANDNRLSFTIQNTGANKVYVRFGAAPVIAGTKYYSFILPPASGVEEGDGGTLTVDHFKGDVWVMTASGTSQIVVTEFIR
mgnify:CR=1 FL=1|tara:strand:- start:1234 stop:1560 length:327 start_codon:yes stop_codon:yes gene_type:complete